ncbi:MAG: hypothetical protein MMC33_010263 [Icmadophila ericetorum]|nr:hypothetical protein [Icmadophila ericetorum]
MDDSIHAPPQPRSSAPWLPTLSPPCSPTTSLFNPWLLPSSDLPDDSTTLSPDSQSTSTFSDASPSIETSGIVALRQKLEEDAATSEAKSAQSDDHVAPEGNAEFDENARLRDVLAQAIERQVEAREKHARVIRKEIKRQDCLRKLATHHRTIYTNFVFHPRYMLPRPSVKIKEGENKAIEGDSKAEEDKKKPQKVTSDGKNLKRKRSMEDDGKEESGSPTKKPTPPGKGEDAVPPKDQSEDPEPSKDNPMTSKPPAGLSERAVNSTLSVPTPSRPSASETSVNLPLTTPSPSTPEPTNRAKASRASPPPTTPISTSPAPTSPPPAPKKPCQPPPPPK